MGCAFGRTDRAASNGATFLGLMILLAGAGVGCQAQHQIIAKKLAHRATVADVTGLKDTETVEAVKARCAPPRTWQALALKKTALFTDMQWRSPSKSTGVGVAYVRLPFPLPASTLIWLAKQEYCKKANDGKLIAEWTDDIGRPWFEAQNNKYHVRGFVIVKGFEAWIVYCGYKTEQPPSEAELKLARRSVETIIPTPLAPNQSQTPTAEAQGGRGPGM